MTASSARLRSIWPPLKSAPSIAHDTLGRMRVPAFADVARAATALVPYLYRTPLLRHPALDQIAGAPVWLKAECLQVTGSFKARGAFNAMLALPSEARARGVVAYSTGNHGQAIAFAARQLGVCATIVIPRDAPEIKRLRAAREGARIVSYDPRCESREAIGMRLLAESGGTLIPPGDHPEVLAGQGTVALEVLNDLPADALANLGIFAAPCGGGGLMAGSGLVLHALAPDTQLLAVEPAGFDDTVRSLRSGRREINMPGVTSLCDALRAPSPAQLPFEINRQLLSGGVAVSDSEVAAAVRFALEELHLLVEPSGAVALAALLAGRLASKGRDVVIVLSGGNIDMAVLAQLIGAGVVPP